MYVCMRELSAFPDFEGLIDRASDHKGTRAMKGNGRHKVGVRIECLVTALGAQVPNAHCLVVARTHKVLTARMHNDSAHPIVMSNLHGSELE